MKRPTESDWEAMVFCQRIAHAVRKSDDLRIPRNPEKALKELERLLTLKQRKDVA